MAFNLTNPGFESGNLTGWTIVPDTTPLENNLDDASVGTNGVLSGAYSLGIGGGAPYTRGRIEQSALADIGVDSLEMLAYMRGTDPGGPAEPAASLWTVRWGIDWYDSNDVFLSTDLGNVVQAAAEQWRSIRATFSRPQYGVKARVFLYVNKGTTFGMNALYIDEASWNNSSNFAAQLVQPPDGAQYAIDQAVPLAISYSGTSPTIASVEYFEGTNSLVEVDSAPWAGAYAFDTAGEYSITAQLTMSDASVITVGPHEITVLEAEGEPREYRASNAQAPMVISNFNGISAAMPSTSRVLGVEVILDYKLAVLGRLKDINVTVPSAATPTTVFDAVSAGIVQVNLLAKSGESYTALGAGATTSVPIQSDEFVLEETGVTQGKKWVYYEQSTLEQVTLGSETELFGQSEIPAFSFLDYALGITFYPELNNRPAYADDGDASYRIMIDKIRVRLYFDAGSVEYYFASPDKTQCIKGTLAAAYVLDGDLRTGDAEGVLQLTSDLEVMDGTQTWIGNDWTIHAAYPPTDANYIGDVGDIEGQPEAGMEYNWLPTQAQVRENRSRYLFVSENFYGDPTMNAMYGVHGLPRAFTYNGDYFYKIYTQKDPNKDSPRSLANHHTHLALGFDGGRVDISVVGEPYNFDGADGASSWAFGDKVVGLLPLSGTILGVFGSKSIWGIAGTTVDNFATQVISPNIGAIEYTICDMGFPVYANAYGVYTLNQTQQYGDYLGQPMSADISPWIRPRLLRKSTSNKEVVCAFPVRSKNQYRVCFSDGYVSTMTLNGQQTPTFSFQKYFVSEAGSSCTRLESSPEYESLYRLTPDPHSTGGYDYLIISSTDETEYYNIEYVGDGAIDPNYPWFGAIELREASGSFNMYVPAGEGDMIYLGCVTLGPMGPEAEVNMYTQPAIVPAAVSSELDNHGEERIHIAPYVDEDSYEPTPPSDSIEMGVSFGEGRFVPAEAFVNGAPDWFTWGDEDITMYNATLDEGAGGFMDNGGGTYIFNVAANWDLDEHEIYITDGENQALFTYYVVYFFGLQGEDPIESFFYQYPNYADPSAAPVSIVADTWSGTSVYNEGTFAYELQDIVGDLPTEPFIYGYAECTQDGFPTWISTYYKND